MYYFKKKIKCLDCSKNFRGITERGKRKYVCSGYANYSKDFCEIRYKLEEDMLLDLVINHYDLILVKSGVIDGSGRKIIRHEVEVDKLIDTVDRIEVSPKQGVFTIFYTDRTQTKIEPNHHQY